ncbi:hypothetical protein BGZ79_004313, partial [Entomortierella chlamydospora]
INPDNGNNITISRSAAALAWSQKKLASGERVSMIEFSQEFGYIHEQDAHAAFVYQLSLNELPRSIRIKLSKEYEMWCHNEGAEYWASRMTDYGIEVSTQKTQGILWTEASFWLKESLESLLKIYLMVD